jgi:hypothetical protein
MGVNPWWLWEGAAVLFRRHNSATENVGKVVGFWDDSFVRIHPVRETQATVHYRLITPIQNYAVTLAPEGATHVRISHKGRCHYRDEIGTFDMYAESSFIWPQCPEDLRGKTWELPKGEKL